jgi:glycine/D-amino acid oxidase-like deaminating enzyme/nitrite reductase/ring-hydroxylating ferredoxin subunit
VNARKAREETNSLWMRVAVAPRAKPLAANATCDTVIVGAGIAGLSVAYELASRGQQIIVLDRGPIAGGVTSRTTAHLAPVCDDGLAALVKLRGLRLARLFQESQEAAVDRIEALTRTLGIDCNFRRLDAHVFPTLEMEPAKARKQIDGEYKAGRKLGVKVEYGKGVPLKGFEHALTLRYRQQATFHPLKYLRAIAAAVGENRGRLYAHSPVTKIEKLKDGVRVTTAAGRTVKATQAVFATNSPVNDRLALHSKMAPYRTYAMAFTIARGTLPDALYWDLGDPYHYVRLNPGPGATDYLIVGGADHKSGEVDDGDVRFEAVEAWIRQLIPSLGKEVHRWSGQVLDTIDHCGFIGRNPGSRNVYISTGDSGQGITHGVLAGLLLKDLILTGTNKWAEVYEPSRKPISGIVNFARENSTAVANFAEYLAPGEIDSAQDLKPGEGGVLRDGVHRLAACRDRSGKLHVHSAACTHLGCIVHWNSTEQCWDCPCHGSHFAPDGAVLNGPALTPLKRVRAPR